MLEYRSTATLSARAVIVAISATGLIGGVLGAVTASAKPTTADPSGPGAARVVTWGACDPERTDIAPGVECGTLRLPVSWDRPDGETYVTRVYRQRAEGPRRGTLLDFPSGPGSTADLAFTSLREVAPGYDLVGLDPRGVASTAPVTCAARPIVDAPLATPVDPVSFEAGRATRERIAQSCSVRPASLMNHLDAYSNARDAEALRLALGGPRVVVSGTSYGTLLAARYLELFGRSADGAILQGVLKPGEPVNDFQAVTARSSQRLFDEFAAWCRDSAECAVRTPGPSAAFAAAKMRAATGTIPGRTAMGRRWDAAGAVQAFELAAAAGDFSTAAVTIRALAAGRNPNEDVAPLPSPAERVPFPDRIVCADFDLGIRDVGTAQRVAARAAAGNPDVLMSSNAAAYTVGCSGAPRPDASWRTPFRAGRDFPILLLSNRIDIATPVEWANEVAASLGGRARHVVSDEIGHGTALGDPAVVPAVRKYLAGR
ncbi:alpha/beta hydrolase [Gordonia sinesedis]